MIGFPLELRPLVRPYGLWTGNLFRAEVLRDGEPVPYANIEVEYLNPGGALHIPHAAYATQVMKADANGLFSYAFPKSGWWGFVAVSTTGESVLNPDGDPVRLEQGAVMWVYVRDIEVRDAAPE